MLSKIRGIIYLVILLFLFTNCALHGRYIPLEKHAENPYYKTTQDYVTYYQRGGSVPQKYYLPTPSVRPFYDTIAFVGGRRVRALRRTSGTGSCCARAVFPVEEEYSLKKDTLTVAYGKYLRRGDTLFPLHRGSIYVKE